MASCALTLTRGFDFSVCESILSRISVLLSFDARRDFIETEEYDGTRFQKRLQNFFIVVEVCCFACLYISVTVPLCLFSFPPNFSLFFNFTCFSFFSFCLLGAERASCAAELALFVRFSDMPLCLRNCSS